MSQTKINDFFGARKRRVDLNSKKSDVTDYLVKPVKVESNKKRKRINDGLRDIREVFASVSKIDDEPSHKQQEDIDSEQTPERKAGGILYFHDSKRRRKQLSSDVDQSVDTSTANQTPFSCIKSARKRIFDSVTDEFSNSKEIVSVVQHNERETSEASTRNAQNEETRCSSESKLTVEQVKQRLANCSKLSELRYKLAKINDCTQKLNEFKSKTKSPTKVVIEPAIACKRERKNAIVESPKKYLSTNVTPQSKKHAFEKFASLSSSEHETGLLLPFKFRTLLEMFRCVDFIVSLLHNRDETCTFDKLKKSFEEMTRKKIDVSRLTQILKVYPESYKLSYVKNINRASVSNSYQLVVCAPNVCKMTPTVLLTRKETFHNKLLEIVKQQHQFYLSSLDPPVCVQNESLQRWHPNFKLEEIPDIEPQQSLLPSLPSGSETPTFANYFRSNSDENNETSTHDVQNSEPTKIESGVLKGISSSLLMKIRAKEAMAVAREMIRKPENEKRITMLNKLPEIMKIIHNYFICDGRGAIRMDEVLQKCVQSYHTFISTAEVKEHITLLCDLFPEWIYLLTVRKGEYLKIDKNATIVELLNRLDDKRSKMRHE